MARFRTIKPEFWTDEALGECSLQARLMFIGTWTFADDYGNLDRSPRQLKAQVFPYDVIDCEPLIQELIKAGVLIEYSADGRKYLHIKGFATHQKIERPSKPRIPLYEPSPSTHRVLADDSSSPQPVRECNEKGGSTPSRKKTPKHPIPEEFDLTSDRRAYAEKHLPNVDAAALMAVFRSTSKAKAWQYADWDQHWQTLVRQWAPDSGHWSSGQYPKHKAETWT